mmetsp:Transcript_148926/g.361604  ORF Transcript_148926/g.361604 Transcript_148926/m.361604 type:complete len:263 (+) Transcript_148926:151-939(+)
MRPGDGTLGAEAVADGIQDLVAIKAKDVLLLGAKRQHASALAEHHQVVAGIGLVEKLDLRTDAHGHVLARRANVDQEAVTHFGGGGGLDPRQRHEPVLAQLQHARRALDRCLVVLAVLQEFLRDLTVLGVLPEADHHARGRGDFLAKVLDGDLGGPVALRRVGDLRMLQQLRLGADKRLVRVDHASLVVLHGILGNLVCLRLRGLAFVGELIWGLVLELLKEVLPRGIHQPLGRNLLLHAHLCNCGARERPDQWAEPRGYPM